MKFDIIGKRYRYFIISALLVVASIIALSTVGLKGGIEFSSGTVLTIPFENTVEYDQVRDIVSEQGYTTAIVQSAGSNEYIIRTVELTDTQRTALEDALTQQLGPTGEISRADVNPKTAAETVRQSIIAILAASVGILLYIAWAFRRMPHPFRYGACAVIALVHDAIVALGIFSILGAILNWEINLMFITGLLAVIGYSVNNMVVIFDRIRENTIRGLHPEFAVTVNGSLVETLSRSMNTTLTTLLTVMAVLLFVGSDIQNFAIVLLIGIVAGTFDSIFVAPALLVVWDRGEWHRFLPWKRAKAA
jgi:preprotein translocase subunit SecF